jgi:hypothetical protein
MPIRKSSSPGKVAPSGRQPDMQDFERLGVFYLGRPFDPAAKQTKPGWLLYDSKDLLTHAVCVGMTGSGKTGLCIGLLEEAAIDGIPAIVIDPKGDLANLLLTFPQLRGEDFAPWVNEEDARKKGLSVSDYAAQQAGLWRKGLGEWGQSGERIRKLREAAGFVVYTPGSNAGLPVSILNAFAVPPASVMEDIELLRQEISTVVSSLLGLAGMSADPIKSPSHILMSTIIETAWKRGQDLDLVPLIEQIQTPSFSRLGAMDIESFFPAPQRFELAKRLNGLIAAPSFESWMEGAPLDVGSFLHTQDGKPRISIFSIAHLNDEERMAFVTLLLNQTVSWMRTQSGTTSLRAILYMDEIFGYFPPVKNPPSKTPLLTLLKQARAYGIGVVLATQNPVDLDYKGLSNTGTWFIGRLQTERDKARVMEGLEGAAASSGKKFDKQRMEQILAGLGNRVFLLNNVHEDAPEIFQTRWTLSYLRGPMTRGHIKQLMDPQRPSMSETANAAGSAKEVIAAKLGRVRSRPILPPDILQYFIPVRSSRPEGGKLVYMPVLFGSSEVRVSDKKLGIDANEDCMFTTPLTEGPVAVDWDDATPVQVAVSDLEHDPRESSEFGTLPSAASKGKNYELWKKDLANWLYRTHAVELMKSPDGTLISKPDESERDFKIRVGEQNRALRDVILEKLRRKYAPKTAALQERLRRAEQAVERQTSESQASKVQAALSVGASILGAFLGRKTISAANIGRASTAIRGAGRVMKETQDVGQAKDNVAALEEQLATLDAQFQADMEAAVAHIDENVDTFEKISLRPTKSNITIRLCALAWVPYWQDEAGTQVPAWQ